MIRSDKKGVNHISSYGSGLKISVNNEQAKCYWEIVFSYNSAMVGNGQMVSFGEVVDIIKWDVELACPVTPEDELKNEKNLEYQNIFSNKLIDLFKNSVGEGEPISKEKANELYDKLRKSEHFL